MEENKKYHQKNITGKWDGFWYRYCPESLAKGETVRMRLNSWDFYESEKIGLLIARMEPGVQAVILRFRGNGDFRGMISYADEVAGGAMLAGAKLPGFNPGNYDMDSVIILQKKEELKDYIEKM